jgi:hypothetical protein
MGSSKVGDISFTSVGEQSYGGNQCNKITGDGNFYFEIYGQSMEANFDIDAYISQSDGILNYCEYSFEFCNPFSMDMDMILDIDKDNGEITITVDSSLIDSQSTVIKTPDEYWECTILRDNLYVGYSKEVTYAMDVLGIDTEVSLKISVIGIEDVTVKKGTFEDCYIIQIDQEQAYSTSTSTIWVDEDGICLFLLFLYCYFFLFYYFCPSTNLYSVFIDFNKNPTWSTYYITLLANQITFMYYFVK